MYHRKGRQAVAELCQAQEFDQQVISQINRLMDKQRLSRCTYDVIKLQFRWNLNKIWMQFRLYLDKRFKSLINR